MGRGEPSGHDVRCDLPGSALRPDLHEAPYVAGQLAVRQVSPVLVRARPQSLGELVSQAVAQHAEELGGRDDHEVVEVRVGQSMLESADELVHEAVLSASPGV